MRIRGVLAPVLAASVICVAVAMAAPVERGLEGWGRGQAYDRLYDANREVFVPSTVLKVEHFVPQPGMADGVRAFVATGRESLWVHLGPAAWMDAQGLSFVAGDAVVVTGALVLVGAERVIVAAKVDKGKRTLKLRDASGVPAWSNFHRRSPA
jgi:hypothetical protein